MEVARGHTAATLLEASGSPIDVDPEIRALWEGARVAGIAYTVQGAGGDNLALHRAVASAPEGAVLVADVGSAAYGHWGEVLAVAAQARKITGLLIDGGVRDAAEQKTLGFPVFSRNNAIRGTRKDFAGVLGCPICVGGVEVRTGDLIVGDVDGVVVIPSDRIQEVLEAADERIRKETDYMQRLHAGESSIDIYNFRPRTDLVLRE